MDTFPLNDLNTLRLTFLEIHIAKSGRESGSFTEAQIQPMLESVMLEPTDFVWHKELEHRIPAYQFLGLRPPVQVRKGFDAAAPQAEFSSHGIFRPPPACITLLAGWSAGHEGKTPVPPRHEGGLHGGREITARSGLCESEARIRVLR